MTISKFRLAALPDNIVNNLVETSEACAEMNTLAKLHPHLQGISADILLVVDAYHYMPKDATVIDDVIYDYFISNSNNPVTQFARSYAAGKAYAKRKIIETGILTAVDTIKINKAICHADEDILSENDSNFDHDSRIAPTWRILTDLYGPKRQYHILLEAAITLTQFLTLPGEDRINIPALEILLSTVAVDCRIFSGIISQWILLTDPRTAFNFQTDCESILLHVLRVFERTFRFHSQIIYELLKAGLDLEQKLRHDCPAASSQLADLLVGSICVRNDDVKIGLSISSKTAINYLKRLEQCGVLHSIKQGRDRYYFNNIYSDLIKRSV